MTVTTLEPVTIEYLDWEPEMACETTYCAHGRPQPTHILILPCACRGVLACTPCTDHSKGLLRLAMRENKKLYCNRCGPECQYSPSQFRIESL